MQKLKVNTSQNKNIDLSVIICGVRFNNPMVLVSGILVTPQDLIRMANNGAGGITTKSTSLEIREGHPLPRVVRFNHGFLNSVGLKNPGIEKATEELRAILNAIEIPIIVSIVANKASDFQTLAKKIAKVKPHFIELNLSCPNVEEEFGYPFATDANISAKIVEKVKKVTGNIPIIAKLSPNVSNIKKIAKAVESAGVDVISAINTVGPGMVIDIYKKRPTLGNKRGGVSGPAIKPVAIRCVYDIFEAVKIPIIGLGGVTTGEDAVEMIMAGASSVGIGSAFYLRGKNVFNDITKEIEDFMKKENYKSIKEFKGAAH